MKDRTKIQFRGLDDLPPMAMSLRSMAANPAGSWRNLRPVIDYASCSACMSCWKFCPDAAVEIRDERPVINLDFCKGCSLCAEECPKKCIVLVEEEK